MKRRTLLIGLVAVVLVLLFAGCSLRDLHRMGAMRGHMGQQGEGGMAGHMGGGMGSGMGQGGDMMRIHHAEIPADYAGLTNPIAADDESLARGQAAYETYCIACHGAGGMGDGDAGKALDPTPAPIAHTSQMLGDDHLFWRISEGGTHFSTAMPAWEGVLDEQTRWDLINYVRALGAGTMPGQGMGAMNGARFDPAAEAARHASMAAAGVEKGVITQEEADTFLNVHAAIDAYLAEHPMARGTGTMLDRQNTMLTALVDAGTISQMKADTFRAAHDKLIEAGLMQ